MPLCTYCGLESGHLPLCEQPRLLLDRSPGGALEFVGIQLTLNRYQRDNLLECVKALLSTPANNGDWLGELLDRLRGHDLNFATARANEKAEVILQKLSDWKLPEAAPATSTRSNCVGCGHLRHTPGHCAFGAGFSCSCMDGAR